ncbi:MAG: hypothetical protein OXP69_09030 [Spirochaetaceae bacterium]|nr:hypothetical protein [Spirochaetaceae bacterium]
MKGRRVLIAALAAAVVLAVAAVVYVVYVAGNPADTTYEFVVRDAVSGNWVWDATFRLQGRVIRSHFQSDRGPRPQVFTRLQPGEATLRISAPSYQEQTIPVTLKRGENRRAEPVELVGREIPDLASWIIFEGWEGGDLVQELRPVSSAGPAVINHPVLDLWIGARVSVQVKDGVPVREETDAGAARGEELYRGKLQWTWDAAPETTFRYGAAIPGAEIKASSAPYWVIDYLIVVPDPAAADAGEIDRVMEQAWQLPPEEIAVRLEQHQQAGTLAAYQFTSWNVAGGRR